MIIYEIRFKFDIEKILDNYSDDLDIELIEIDDDCFIDIFNDSKTVKDFQDWYNDDWSNNENIIIHKIAYRKENEDIGILTVSVNTEISDEQTFANELVNTLFELEWPIARYRVYGVTYKDDWDYRGDTYTQKQTNVDTEDSKYITKYTNVTINKK